MSYTAHPTMAGQDVFDNTFAPPAAYKAFLQSCSWPDKTVLILENRAGTSHGSTNRSGTFQTTGSMGLEAHVKDEARFKGDWGFFAFEADGKPARRISYTETCYSCHQQHAAADTTFVQFDPTLLPAATKPGTLSKSYLN